MGGGGGGSFGYHAKFSKPHLTSRKGASIPHMQAEGPDPGFSKGGRGLGKCCSRKDRGAWAPMAFVQTENWQSAPGA